MMNEILYLRDSKVLASEEAMQLPEFKNLFVEDDSPDKLYFFNVLYYVYFTYKPDGILKNLYLKDRKEHVCRVMLKDSVDHKKLDADPLVQKLIAIYTKLTMSFIKRDYEQTKVDIESLNKHISTIPFVKVIPLKNRLVSFEYEGNIINTTVNLEVEIDNSEEKSKALKLKETLYDLEDKLRQKVLKEDMSGENDTLSMIEKSQQ